MLQRKSQSQLRQRKSQRQLRQRKSLSQLKQRKRKPHQKRSRLRLNLSQRRHPDKMTLVRKDRAVCDNIDIKALTTIKLN